MASSSASTSRAVMPSVPRRQKLPHPPVVLLPPRERRRHRPARRRSRDDFFDKVETRARHVHVAGRLARVFEPHEDVSGAHQPAREAGEGKRVGHHRTDRGAGLVRWVLRGRYREGMSRLKIKVARKRRIQSDPTWLFSRSSRRGFSRGGVRGLRALTASSWMAQCGAGENLGAMEMCSSMGLGRTTRIVRARRACVDACVCAAPCLG